MSGEKEKKKVSDLVGKSPKVDLDSLNLSKPLREARELMKDNPSLLTPFQLKVISLYRLKEVREITRDEGIGKDSVYAVFRGLKEKRRKARMYLDLMRKLSRNPKLHRILSIKTTREEDKALEEDETLEESEIIDDDYYKKEP